MSRSAAAPPRFIAEKMEKIRVLRRKVAVIESQIAVSVDLAKISTYAAWKKLDNQIRNSVNILMESMVARNTVDEESSDGQPVRLRKVNDDDRRELASDIRALKSLMDTCKGSEGRVSRLRANLVVAKDDLASESKRLLV